MRARGKALAALTLALLLCACGRKCAPESSPSALIPAPVPTAEEPEVTEKPREEQPESGSAAEELTALLGSGDVTITLWTAEK